MDPDLYSLQHYGTPRHSGRYPWGSGKDPYQRNSSFLSSYKKLIDSGVPEKDIAKAWGMTTRQLRARKSVAIEENRYADMAMAVRLKEKGYSQVAIGKRMGVGESQVRNLLKYSEEQKSSVTIATANSLQKQVDKCRYLDVGVGVEQYMGISNTRLGNAIDILVQKGYKVHNVPVKQLGTGKFTTVKVLGSPDTDWAEAVNNKDLIKSIEEWSNDGGLTYESLKKPVAVSSDRIMVRYGDQGGSEKDGVIELRRGVEDLSLGNSNYAQVRINVEDSHYLKGMAIYNDNMPKGVDIIFNTNKKSDVSKLDTMKPINKIEKTGEVDAENPFGASIKQRTYIGSDGKEHLSAINIVGSGEKGNEEGTWGGWKKTLSSQMLSKQSTDLAKKQLALRYDSRVEEFEEIMSLTNPTVRKHYLQEFADSCDGSSVHLEAAALPRQASHVLLPLTTIKDNEIYAPGYNNGEKVVLIRYPHGGKFEIPELTVNNNNEEGKRIITPKALDAVGINSKVAEQLSGADFDGDTVLVIPNKPGKYSIKTEPPLEKLKNFDPKTQYKLPDDAPRMTDYQKGLEMGKISNLITDMTLAGANNDELAAAVRHSMVVIDAQKHHLNFQQSFLDNDIPALYKKYQPREKGPDGGASTIISRASSKKEVETRRVKIDKETGKKIYIDKPTDTRIVVERDEDGNIISSKKVRRTETSRKMLEVDDAYELTSGGSKEKTVNSMEHIYADHANRLKDLANRARKEAENIEPIKKSISAKDTYKEEVSSLKSKLNIAEKNAPKERMANIIANVDVKNRKQPDWSKEELRKEEYKALERARRKLGAKKKDVEVKFTPREWEAVQAGAISNTMFTKLLKHADKDNVRELALPKENKSMTDSRVSRAKSMLNAGCTLKEVADVLGVSVSTLSKAVN